MMHRVKIGDATLDVDLRDDNYDEDPFGDGTPGFGGHFEVNRKQYAELHEACPFEHYSIDEDSTTFDPEEDDEDETVNVPVGDDFIVFANAISIEGGDWRIDFHGNPYWFFHDLCHARYDCSGGRVEIDPHGDSENRALIEGAKEAHEQGIGLSLIFGQLAQVLKPFEERFSRSTDAIESFAEYLEEVLTMAVAEV